MAISFAPQLTPLRIDPEVLDQLAETVLRAEAAVFRAMGERLHQALKRPRHFDARPTFDERGLHMTIVTQRQGAEPFIVTANYRDRGGRLRWIERRESESPDEARPAGSMVLENVELHSSAGYPESLLGCLALARVGRVIRDVVVEDVSGMRRLTYAPSGEFLDADSLASVSRAKRIVLNEAGQMFYVPA